MAITVSDFPKGFRPAYSWGQQDIKWYPYEMQQFIKKCTVKSATSVFIGALVDTVETGDASTDLTIITVSADNSVVPLMYVLDTEYNRAILARDNDKDHLSGETKETTYFAASSIVDCIYLMPGMIVSLCFANSIAVKPGVKIQSAGGGKADLYATVNARLGHLLGQFPNEASANWGDVLITF